MSNLIAGLLSTAFPGLGYSYLGFKRDGLVAFVGVSLLYFVGLTAVPPLIFVAFIIHGLIALASFTMRDPFFEDT